MSEIEFIESKPVADCFHIIKNLKDIKYDLIYIRIEKTKYFNCEFETFKIVSCAFVDVVFENCVIENLLIKHDTIFKNVKFINCKIKNINMMYNRADLKSLIELQKLESKLTIYETQIDIASNNSFRGNYFMFSDIIISELYDSFNNIRISIGCKSKSISEWNYWFEHSTEEYKTSRNTEKFEKIKSEYYDFRNETLKIIENLKKGLN